VLAVQLAPSGTIRCGAVEAELKTDRKKGSERLTDATLAHGAVGADAVSVNGAGVSDRATSAPSIDALICAALRESGRRGGSARLAGVGCQNTCDGLGQGSFALAFGLPNTCSSINNTGPTRTTHLGGTGAASTHEVLAHTIVIAEAGKEMGKGGRK